MKTEWLLDDDDDNEMIMMMGDGVDDHDIKSEFVLSNWAQSIHH